MAYDTATSQLVLFGGFSFCGVLCEQILNSTWTWDGTTWTKQSPATSPPARDEGSIAYDPATSQLVLFGGYGSNGDSTNGVQGDTWTWDGTTWTKQSPATSPPARAGASLAYDPATSQLILFGGADDSGRFGDTWTWDGTTWTKQSPAASPSARYLGSMAYDPATSQLILFGGDSDIGLDADTWTWDGTTWTKQSPASSPPIRFTASMAYDPASSQLVLFGGQGSGVLDDTWTWDGTTWTKQSPTTSPPAREDTPMAYDATTSQLVLFGGDVQRSVESLGDTWTYSSGQASQSIAYSTAAPANAAYSGSNDQTYVVDATATSGLPVTLSIDSSSTSGCTVSGMTISYGSGTGTCVIDANQPGNASYLAAPQITQTFTVGPAHLAITASSPTMTFGGTVPVITASYSGFVSGDGPGNLTTQPACSTTATNFSPAGTYPATCSGAVDRNYTISYAAGEVTVNQANPEISWSTPVAITYGTPLSSAQLDATSSVPGTLTYSPPAGTVLQPGNQTLTVTFVPQDAVDYTSALATVTISIGFSTPCLTTTRNGSLKVTQGQATCIGSGGMVTGSITITGGALWVNGGTISGSLNSAGATGITLCATKVSGSVSVTGSSGPVVIGASGCSGDTFSGNVSITNNTGGVSFENNTVSGSLVITHNTGGFTYLGNTIYGSVTNSGNS